MNQTIEILKADPQVADLLNKLNELKRPADSILIGIVNQKTADGSISPLLASLLKAVIAGLTEELHKCALLAAPPKTAFGRVIRKIAAWF